MKKTTTIKKIILSVLATTLFGFGANAQWKRIGADIIGRNSNYFGKALSMNKDGSVMAFSLPGFGAAKGYVAFKFVSSSGYRNIIPSIAGLSGEQFGSSISLNNSGQTIAIGAKFNKQNGNSTGQVRIYKNGGSKWVLDGSISGDKIGDQSGSSVSISGNGSFVAIGAPLNDSNGNASGQVRVFEKKGNAWAKIGNDIYGDTAIDFLGTSVSLSDNGAVVAVGAPGSYQDKKYSGYVKIYKIVNGVWKQIGSTIKGSNKNGRFGSSISLSADGTIVAIGSPYTDNVNDLDVGLTRVFNFINGSWKQIGKSIEGDKKNSRSGSSISLSDDGTLLGIGEPGNGVGQVRVFKNISGTWTFFGKPTGSGVSHGGDQLGIVSICGNGKRLTTGAPSFGSAQGRVRIFINTQVGIKKMALQNIRISPNPVTDKLTINNTKYTIYNISIIDITGKVVKTMTLKNKTIDVSELANGIYFLNINTEKGILKGKFIKE